MIGDVNLSSEQTWSDFQRIIECFPGRRIVLQSHVRHAKVRDVVWFVRGQLLQRRHTQVAFGLRGVLETRSKMPVPPTEQPS